MKMILLPLLLLSGLMAHSQAPRQAAPSCPIHIDVEITRGGWPTSEPGGWPTSEPATKLGAPCLAFACSVP
jgi:hypothetical protein